MDAEHAEARALRPAVLNELVGLHARVLRRMPVVQFFVVLGLGALVYPFLPLNLFLGWSALTLSVECLRALMAIWFLRQVATEQRLNVRWMHGVFVALAVLAGGAVGLGATRFLPHLPIERQAVLSIVLYAMPAAGVAVSVASKEILAAYSAAILLPAAFTWARLFPDELSVLGLTLVFLVFLISIASDGERLLLRSVRIRQERDRVVIALERSNAEVREAMHRAEQLAQTRARVLAAASHDLRQPLHALSIYSAILSTEPDPESLRDVGHNIDQLVRSLGSLLNGLLDLSRLSVGAYLVERKAFQLDELALEVCREFDAAAAAKGLALLRDFAPVGLQGDRLVMARIVRNLLDNAIKYTDVGEVRVTTRGEGGRAVLSVADTGRGIAKHEQTRVFEEFYQVDNPGRDRSKGVGLGLAIVQRLAELIGASIQIESTVGQGSRFTMELSGLLESPSVFSAVHAATTTEAHSPWLPAAGLRVVVVDDERDILHSMRGLLRLWRLEVHTAASPREADALLLQTGAPDLLIADLRLGAGEHGAELASRLQRRHGPFPVLIITGETASGALQEAAAAGFALLHKPITPEQLRDAIQAALEPSR